MNQIKIKKITLENFCGIAKGETVFADGLTEIKGNTGFGKSSINHAFAFVLGLPLPEKVDFAPTAGDNGRKISKLTTKVIADLVVDSVPFELQAVASQKWKVNKDTQIEEYSGYDYTYIFDGVEKKTTLYKENISALFGINYEDIIKLVYLKHFNTTMDWQSRRKWLFEKLGIEQRAKKLAENYPLITIDLLKGKSEDDIRSMLNALEKSIKDEQLSNKTLIDDTAKVLAELSQIDFGMLEIRQNELQSEIDKLQALSNDSAKESIKSQRLAEIAKCKNEISAINSTYYSKMTIFDNEKKRLSLEITTVENTISILNDKIKRLDSEIEDVEFEQDILSKTEFDESKNICPTCGQSLPFDQQAKLVTTFTNDKQNKTEKLDSKRRTLAQERDDCSARISIAQKQLDGLKSKLEAHTVTMPKAETEKIAQIESEIAQLQSEILELKDSDAVIENRNKIDELRKQRDEIIKNLGKKQELNKAKEKIQFLKNRSKELAEQDKERLLKRNQLKEYVKAKIQMFDESAGEYFSGISIKFFDKLTALSKEKDALKETCTFVWNGASYDSLSGGEHIFADIEVGKGLRKILNIEFPYFVDERQSLQGIQPPYADIPNAQIVELHTDELNSLSFVKIKDIYSESDCMG